MESETGGEVGQLHTCNSFPRTEVLRGSPVGRVQVPIYLLRRVVLALALKLVRMSTGSIEIPMYSLAHPLPSL
ncbi:hypothetical protein K443DRAFT_675501 [Laccaria amethystina LaAM-08-1]|uniref:Uncharacterized protein n=1 Tax=Laccaria amethystina LaAM-08-1 TaxID=1095629 RepID=A0A0C9YAK2_9AGAR|nr:hypothetical protein K443DRAFT_675501 [Laccaria amethystina LaAM-08-1]